VIPTRDRPAALASALVALRSQSGVDLEIVVVDDGGSDPQRIAELVEGAGGQLVRLAGGGAAAARNHGVIRATRDVVCFTDDDCRPDAAWAALLLEAIRAGAPFAGGRTECGHRSNPFDMASERITGHLREFSFAHDPDHGFLASNNVACLRKTALTVPFDERYGLGGEDRDWCARLAAAQGPPLLVPSAVVVHTPGLSLRRFWQQQVRYGRGAYRFAGARIPIRGPLSFYATLIRDAFCDGPLVGLLVLLAQVATLVGALLEVLRGLTAEA
jgi:glycosyltransferase involved in cell wall biosynthesis